MEQEGFFVSNMKVDVKYKTSLNIIADSCLIY